MILIMKIIVIQRSLGRRRLKFPGITQANIRQQRRLGNDKCRGIGVERDCPFDAEAAAHQPGAQPESVLTIHCGSFDILYLKFDDAGAIEFEYWVEDVVDSGSAAHFCPSQYSQVTT